MKKQQKQLRAKSTPKAKTASGSEYAKELHATELLAIALLSAKCEITDRQRLFAAEEAPDIALDLDSSFENVDWSGTLVSVVLVRSVVTLKVKEIVAVQIDSTFQLDYVSKAGFTSGFFDEFSKGPLLLQIAPFIREFVFDMTARMNIPPITLPMLRVNLSPNQGAASQ